MAENLFRDLFRKRQRWIRDADIAVAEADRAFGRAEGDNATRWTMIAAGKRERAAALSLKAGLGLLAKQRYADASRYCCLVGDRERATLNQDSWAAVSTYWEEHGDAAQAREIVALFVRSVVGAGISAESSLKTFRGDGGLSEGHRVEDVATNGAPDR